MSAVKIALPKGIGDKKLLLHWIGRAVTSRKDSRRVRLQCITDMLVYADRVRLTGGL